MGTFDAGSIDAKLTLDRTSFSESLRIARAEAEKDIVIKARVDTGQATADLAKLRAEEDLASSSSRDLGSATGPDPGGASWGLGLMGTAIVAALPLVPELSAGIIGLTGAVANAGVGILGFGAIAMTTISQATAATQKLQAAQNAVNNATTQKALTDALIKQKALIDSLQPSTIQLGQAIGGVTSAWKDFADQFTPEIVRDVKAFTDLMVTALPLIQPVIVAGAGAISTVISTLNNALASPSAKQFFNWMAGQAEHDIVGLLTAMGKFVGGLFDLFRAFTPVSNQIVNGLVGMANAFEHWASGLAASKGFQDFIAYVMKNGPLLTKTVGDLAEAIGHVLAGLMPLLAPMLQVIDWVANLVKNVPTLAITIGVVLAGALWLLNAAMVFLISSTLPNFIASLWGGATAAGALGTAAGGAAAEVDLLGTSALVAQGKLGGLLRLLGITTLAGAGTAMAVLAGAGAELYLLNKTEGPKTPEEVNQFMYGGGNGGSNDPTMSGLGWQQNKDGTKTWIGILQPDGTRNMTPPAQAGHDIPLSDRNTAIPAGPSISSGSPTGSVFNQQVPGQTGSAFGTSVINPLASVGSGAYKLPSSGGGGGAGSGPTAANSAAALFTLQGIDLGKMLLQGIVTGVSPLTDVIQSIQSGLSATGKQIASELQSIFNTAMQYGRAAAASLNASITSPIPMGTMTNVTFDAQGVRHEQVQSSLAASFQMTLLKDQNFVANIKKARALGLAPTLLEQFIQAGPSSADALDALVNGDPGSIKGLNATDAAIRSLGTGYGDWAAQDKYGASMDATLKELLTEVAHQLAPKIAAAVSSGLGGGTKTTQAKAASTPARGLHGK